IYYKPVVRWIWAGSLIMALGGALAISDKRYRFRKSSKKNAKSNEQVA
ncbi:MULTISPECIES: cytochrome c-type biogenesis CcmF C-terminal domain-containing protein, partial [Vibrio]